MYCYDDATIVMLYIWYAVGLKAVDMTYYLPTLMVPLTYSTSYTYLLEILQHATPDFLCI